MRIIYSKQAKAQLFEIKSYISQDNKQTATHFLSKIKKKIEILADFPHIGKVNSTFDLYNIRDLVIQKYKVIYKINTQNIIILAIYRQVNFDEKSIDRNL